MSQSKEGKDVLFLLMMGCMLVLAVIQTSCHDEGERCHVEGSYTCEPGIFTDAPKVLRCVDGEYVSYGTCSDYCRADGHGNARCVSEECIARDWCVSDGEFNCIDDDVYRCVREDGSCAVWQLEEDCAGDEVCVGSWDEMHCESDPSICTEGDKRCNNDDIEECVQDGDSRSWQLFEDCQEFPNSPDYVCQGTPPDLYCFVGGI